MLKSMSKTKKWAYSSRFGLDCSSRMASARVMSSVTMWATALQIGNSTPACITSSVLQEMAMEDNPSSRPTIGGEQHQPAPPPMHRIAICQSNPLSALSLGQPRTSQTGAWTPCQFFYECEGCHILLRPRAGDCCVFCSYGSVPCPPIQLERRVVPTGIAAAKRCLQQPASLWRQSL
jgi:hypothetical protein